MRFNRDYSCLLCLWILWLTFKLGRASESSKSPNIILIVADDLGYNDVSFHGSDQIPTPNIDFLAYNGILLNNYYVSPICTPTRAALLTGRHPVHTGMQHKTIVGDEPYGLPLTETLMSQHLNKLGYRSHIVGKWHLGFVGWEYTPLYRGFESHFGFFQGRHDYYDHTYEHEDQWGLDLRRDKALLWNYTGHYSTDLLRDEAIGVIQRHNQSQPLFLYLPFQSVHSGNKNAQHLQAPLEYIERFSYIENEQRRIYAAMVSVLDDAVGSIYDTLKTTGLLSNSIIVFMTDNGGAANGFQFSAASNFPLRGMKTTLWEGGVKAVGLIHSPLLKKQGYVANQMLHVCDWLPTLYSAAGGNVSELKNLDGYNAWEMLNTNGQNVRDEILHNIDPIYKKAAIRMGDYKLITGHGVKEDRSGWYPPWKLYGDEINLHYLLNDSFIDTKEKTNLRDKLDFIYKRYWPVEVKDRLKNLYQSFNHINEVSTLDEDSERHPIMIDNRSDKMSPVNDYTTGLRMSYQGQGTPVKVKCGVKPHDASKNCHPHKKFCLYKITTDPCEYHNIAHRHPDIVQKMLIRLNEWESTMVRPENLPEDDKGNPKYHNAAWVPWR